jgi:hypothetical protein
MAAKTRDLSFLDAALRRGHKPSYVESLRESLTKASDEALAVCHAWNGDKFGYPGYGPWEWVATEIARAEQAVEALRSIKETSE